MLSAVSIAFFPAFSPPSSGGELRLGGLYNAASSIINVTLLTSTDFGARYEEIVHTPTFRELRFPKDELWREAYATLERSGVKGDLSGLAFALAVSDPRCRLRQRARTLAASADVVIHEFPFSEPIFNDGCPTREVYNSHNFEVSLLSSIVEGSGFEASLLKLIRLEGNLVLRADKVFATSDTDAEKFRLFYGVPAHKLGICPNGFDDGELSSVVEERAKPRPPQARPRLLFTGSGHRPNVEAAQALLDIAPTVPECDFVLAGGMCGAFSASDLPSNVLLFGPFDQPTKLKLLSEADLFLNPVTLGSGTSLKALEALGASLPMVSTPEGVRGLGLISGVHCEICARTAFADSIRRVLADHTLRSSITQAGLQIAREQFSWSQIARTLISELWTSSPIDKPVRPLALALNDYPVMQPGSGGIARVRNLLSGIACDVVLVSFASRFDAGLIAAGVLHVTVPKSTAHQAFENAMNDGQIMSVNDAVASLFASANRALTGIVSEVARRAQVVIFEHPYMAPLLDPIRQANPSLPVIYSAHNVEATHKQAILAGHTMQTALVTFIAELERRLVACADLIVCCTTADYRTFEAASKPLLLVPNGCSLPDIDPIILDFETETPLRPKVGFLGSGHGPNVEAANFIVEGVIPFFPDADFEFVGSICKALQTPTPPNLRLHGLLSETAKTETLLQWDVALNPIESGGGSSLKLPDYMAHGLTSISTPAGARDFSVVEEDAGSVVDRNEFAQELRALLDQPHIRARQRKNAYRYASQILSWDAVTQAYRDRIRDILLPTPAPLPRPKVLVVTYRYTEPSLGGAEEYLIEILKRFRPRCERLDLAAIDVGHLTNLHHFSCSLSNTSAGTPSRLGELFDQMNFFPPEELPEPEVLSRCRDLERGWAREERHLFTAFADRLAAPGRLRLFGGYFWPENHDGTIRRWTSPEFSFLVPARARIFQMSGYASTKKTLRLTWMRLVENAPSQPVCELRVALEVHFNTIVTIPELEHDQATLLLCEVDEHTAPGDHRPFGVLLESAAVQIDTQAGLRTDSEVLVPLQTSNADLSELIDEELRTDAFEDWVAALHQIAQRRDSEMEQNFAAVRGPHSQSMQTWLLKYASSYDTVLVQGIPFDVVPSTVETLSKLGIEKRPRVVTLPHFHGDDRFYHWRRYSNAFAQADATLLFSSSITEHLSLNSHFSIVPGGGIRAEEHGDPTAVSSFRALHQSTNPFFLVLGRKTLSKGYQQVMHAHQVVRQQGHLVDLILIGPDEDGVTAHGDGVYYLGRQPRNVICGALSSCVALATMSRSESFGIVLCEAWLFGKPVLANRSCYSFRELVTSDINGLLATNEDELARHMVRMISSTIDRGRMGLNGFEVVVQAFTWEKVANACFNELSPGSIYD